MKIKLKKTAIREVSNGYVNDNEAINDSLFCLYCKAF